MGQKWYIDKIKAAAPDLLDGNTMKYTIEQLKSAARVLKENCQERDSDCWTCPLHTVNDYEECLCIMDEEWPINWHIDKIKEVQDQELRDESSE